VIHDSPPEKLIFCTGDKTICAAKLRLFWLKLPKLTDKLLIADLFWLVGVLSLNPVAFRGMLDSNGIFLVIFIV